MKNALVRFKDQAKNLTEDGEASPAEYAENRVQYTIEATAAEVGHEAKQQIDKYEVHQSHRI